MTDCINPILDQVLIRPMDSFRSDGGLHLPEAYDDDSHGSNRDMIRDRNQLCLGVVIRAGPGWKYNGKRVPLDVEEGDQVMYNRADAKLTDASGSDEGLVMIRHHAIFMKVEGKVNQVVGGLVSQEESDGGGPDDG